MKKIFLSIIVLLLIVGCKNNNIKGKDKNNQISGEYEVWYFNNQDEKELNKEQYYSIKKQNDTTYLVEKRLYTTNYVDNDNKDIYYKKGDTLKHKWNQFRYYVIKEGALYNKNIYVLVKKE